ncbi:MAG: hypothetical protein J6B08_05240 [Ruminiclostridium sp.]|nr:hypothetical protein [Ruminiclostridium sp.]
MKKPSFTALLYRELLLLKKSLLIGSIGALIFILFPVLILLSFRFGNLKLIIPEEAVSGSMTIIKLMPVMSASLFAMLPSETATNDITKPVWDYFRRSTQASALRLSLAKTVISVIGIAISLIISIPLTYIIAYASGTEVTGNDIGLSLLFIAFMSLMSVVFGASIYFFKSVDKGGLVMTGFMFAFVFGFMAPITGELTKMPPGHAMRDAIMETHLNNVISTLAPFTPLMLMGVILIQFALFLFIFKRREK